MAHLRLDAHLDPVGSLLSLEDQPERFMGDSSFGRGLSGENAHPAVNIFDSPENAVVVVGSRPRSIRKSYDH